MRDSTGITPDFAALNTTPERPTRTTTYHRSTRGLGDMSGALDASDFVLAHNNASMRVRPAGARFAAKRPPRIRSELADPRARELALESVRARQLGLALRQRRQARRACRVWGVAEAAPPTPAAPAFLAARASRRCRRPTFNARIPGLSPASLTCSGATQARLSCRVLLAGFTPASKRPEMLARARSASTSGPDARPVGDDESDAAAHDDPVLRRARRSWFARRSRSRGRWRRALAGRRATGLQQAACRGRDERRRPPPALPNGREGPVRTRDALLAADVEAAHLYDDHASAPAATMTAQDSPHVSKRSETATPSSSGDSTGSAATCTTWSTPSTT